MRESGPSTVHSIRAAHSNSPFQDRQSHDRDHQERRHLIDLAEKGGGFEVGIPLEGFTDGGEQISRLDVLKELLARLERWYFESLEKGMDPVIEAWKKYSLPTGTKIKVTVLNQVFEGVATGIDKNGALLVKKDSGEIIRLLSGDVIEMRQDA